MPGRRTTRSAFVVLQATPDLPLQPIVTGRYHDQFARTDDDVALRERHILLEQIGDVSQHLHPASSRNCTSPDA